MANCGTVLSCDKDKAVIMTEDCNFIQIKSRIGLKNGQEVFYSRSDIYHASSKIVRFWPALPVIAAACLLIFVLTNMTWNKAASQIYAYIDIDINPSVEFIIDKDEKVINVIAINDDGKNVLKQVSFKGLKFEDAVDKYIDQAMILGYLTKEQGRSVLLAYTLSDSTSAEEQKFYEYITSLENLSNSTDYSSTIIKVSASTKELADENGISMGRQAAYISAAQSGTTLTVDDIKKCSVTEVMKIIFTNEESTSVVSKPKATEAETQTAAVAETPAETTTEAPAVTAAAGTENTPVPAASQAVVYTEEPSSQAVVTSSYSSSSITGYATSSGIYLSWDKIYDSNFDGYKVVISRSDSSPAYPDNGYMFWITNRDQTSTSVDTSDHYNGGDIGGYLVPGQTYYFSITALYDGHNVKIPGNVIQVTMPGTVQQTTSSADVLSQALNVSAVVSGSKVHVSWNALLPEKFTYYKVVISKSNSAPKYPTDGYLKYFSDSSVTSCDVGAGESYSNGDIGGKLISGTSYYFSITAVYSSGKIYGNSVRVTLP